MSAKQDQYFEEYENLEVHELMLRDRPRQQAYYKAITQNAHIFKDKVVLDVGAGTGILSAFCAKAGASRVYAVEATNLAKIALQVMEENELTSIVKVVQSKIEDFILPASAEKADIIVSEWMGFYLLHEGMLDSVLHARDNLLKPNGLLFPNEACLYVAPCSVPAYFDDWQLVDGVRMTKFAEQLRQQKSKQPDISCLNVTDLLHDGVVLHWMNLQEVTLQELQEINFRAVVATSRAGKLQGFCLWFECRFPSDVYENGVVLSTSPTAPPTHWKQCVVVLPEPLCEELEAQTPLAFNISLQRNEHDQRKYNLEVQMLDSNAEEHPLPCDCHLTKCILTKAHLETMDTTD